MSEEIHTSSDLEVNQNENQTQLIKKKFRFHIKSIAILVIVASFFFILSIVSYTRSDISESNVSFKDLYGLIDKNPEILARQAVTKNWLGLLGAFFSDHLINGTFGYPIVILFALLIYVFIDIYKYSTITPKKLKNTLFFLILMLFLSGFLSTLQRFTWLGVVPYEWGGLVGYFLSTILASFLGDFGAFFLFLLALFFTIFYKLNFKISDIIKYISLQIKEFFSKKPEKQENETQNDTPNEAIYEAKMPKDLPDDDIEIPDNEDNFTSQSVLKNEIPDPNINNQFKKDVPISQTNIPRGTYQFNQTHESENPFKKSLNITFNQSSSEKKVTESDKFIPKIQSLDPNKIVVSNPEIQKELQEEAQFNPFIPITKKENFEDNWDEDENEIIETNEKIIEEEKQIALQDKAKIDEVTENKINNKELEDLNKENNLKIDKPIVPSSEKNSVQEQFDKPLKVEIIDNSSKIQPLKSLIYSDQWDEKINYTFPKLDFLILQKSQNIVDKSELELNGRILQEKLETFKIYIDNLSITPGPVVTQYEFVPAPGIKISRIESLADDLAMALKAKGIRIIAPIPGKGTVGVEIPNSNPQIVRFSEIVSSDKFQNSDARLPLALGKTINGEVFIEDLTKMPHLLIAGSTGSGKSVGINTIINSLLYKKHPSELKFVIIDPKKVELAQYSQLSQHYLATSPDIDDLIVTNPKDAVSILKSAVLEMENRYDILADAGQRNISDYNKKVKEGNIRESEKMQHHPMPYIVVIIDELADLMLTASKEIEEPITRLAQMARAVGIHLIVATQRPSVDVITGLIKANFPARVAYLVASKIDSRTILDQQGAEQLLGNGDMLILPPGSPKPIRVQNAFISTDEVERICNFIGGQEGYSEPYLLPSSEEESNNLKDIDPSDRDPLFEDAARLIINMQQASVSMLQRKMKIGYARAGRIMDELEAAGIVGSSKGSKSREVLLDSESQLEAYL
ncbi:MAG: DNA translocase FtsK 4TM domain-containing protein [Candidatus Kapaibacteriota bacterium]